MSAAAPERPPPRLESSWLRVLEAEFQAPYLAQLKSFLEEERRRAPIFPPGREIFAALNSCPLPKVRVVILGQDPYHGPGQANGLAFSVREGAPLPPSLQNIFRELSQDLRCPPPPHGDLSPWAAQGVLLLNTVLTVRARRPGSHRERGWERFTDAILKNLNERCEGLAFLLWGAAARQKARLIDRSRHLLLSAAHPSPRSAERGFFGCRHFSQVNQHLLRRGERPIMWAPPVNQLPSGGPTPPHRGERGAPMPLEIERKFLVRGAPWSDGDWGAGAIYRQGYLARTPAGVTVRVRLAKGRGTLTVKGPTKGISRAEFEYEIPAAEAESLLNTLCAHPLIEKVRWVIPWEGARWEIDRFSGENEGLAVAEIELPSEESTFALPPWLGREVSGDLRYSNVMLQENPWCRWGAGEAPP